MLTAKQRDSNLLAYDDTPPYTQRSISLGKPSTSRKSSEAENSLPIPMHTRAASTPAHMEAPRNNEQIHLGHKRYPSCVETSPRQDAKKYSADSYLTRNADDRFSKRASSESKEKITKRNASSPAAISLLSAANEKMHRVSSEDRSRMPAKQNTLPIKASPELLAELLRGSSEKMTTFERERNKKIQHADAYALPMAVQQFLVSVCSHTIYYTLLTHSLRNSISFAHIRSHFVYKALITQLKHTHTMFQQGGERAHGLNLQLENKYRIHNVCE